jgi:hypothetical protein
MSLQVHVSVLIETRKLSTSHATGGRVSTFGFSS